LVAVLWRLVKVLIECGFGEMDKESELSMRFLKM